MALYSDSKEGEVPPAIIKKTLYTNELASDKSDKQHKAKADSAGYILPSELEEVLEYGPVEEPLWTYTGLADVNAFGLSPQLLHDIVNHRQKFKQCVVKPTLVIPSSSNTSLFDKQPDIIHGCFPTLFPYGRGGPYDERKDKIAMHVYLMHLMRLSDFRFRTHAPFVFALFSLAQRQRVSNSAQRSLKMKYFIDFQKDLKHITQDTLQHCIDDLREAEVNGEYPRLSHCKNEVARKAFGKLLNQLKVIGGRLPLTDAAKQNARFEAIAMNIKLGIADLFITVNPTDVHAPIVCHFADQHVPLLNLDDPDMPKNIASALQRKKIVCSDAMAAVQFSHAVMCAFNKSLLGYGSGGKLGVLGDASGFHFNPEEQNRGSLHYHGMVWLAHKPDSATFRRMLGDKEFQQQILRYLGEVIKHESPAQWQQPAATELSYTALLEPKQARSILPACKQQLLNEECKDCLAKHEHIVGAGTAKSDSIDQHIACRRIGDPSQPEFKESALRDLTMLVGELVTHDINHRAGCFKYQRRGKKTKNIKKECRFHFPKELGLISLCISTVSDWLVLQWKMLALRKMEESLCGGCRIG